MNKKKKKQDTSIPIEDAYEAAQNQQDPEQQQQSDSSAEQAQPSLQQQYAELKERYQRLGADYANYQKRSQRQIEQASQFSQEAVARSLLSVLDNFDHTLQRASEDMNPATIMQGVQIVYDHLLNALGSFGMKRVNIQLGTDFDPSIHEAVLHEETDQMQPNKVLRELSAGYTMNERTLRPAKVSVAKAIAQPQPESEQSDQ